MLAKLRERGEVIAAGIEPLDALQEGAVDRHDVFEGAVRRAGLLHEDRRPAVALFLDDAGADLAGPPVDQRSKIALAGEHIGAHFLHALRA
jgi:hypothetical protein